MREMSTLARAAVLLAAGAFFGAAATAHAQAPPPLCQLNNAGDFTKTVTLAKDADLSGDITPGDTVEYTVAACNSGTTDCFAIITDDIDAINNDPASLNLIDYDGGGFDLGCPAPNPTVLGCGGSPADGGALCMRGTKGSPRCNWTKVATTTQCGRDCAVAPPVDQIAFRPDLNTTPRLKAGECFYLVYRALVDPAKQMTVTECICNQALSSTSLSPPAKAVSNNNPWTSLATPAPTAPGCHDIGQPGKQETCRTGGCTADPMDPTKCGGAPPACTQSNTCIKVRAGADLGSKSQKCIAGTPCGTTAMKAPGAAVTYQISIENIGNATAPAVNFSDSMTQTSSLGSPCINTTSALPTVQNLTCTGFTPPGCPIGFNVTYMPGPMQVAFSGGIDIPAGAKVTFDIVATVDATAAGSCTNAWRLNSGINLITRKAPDPIFSVAAQADFSSSTKCINIASPGTGCPPDTGCIGVSSAACRPAGSQVTYNLQWSNNGNQTATEVRLRDDLNAAALGCSGGITNPTLVSCVPSAACSLGATCPGVTLGPIPAGIFNAGPYVLPAKAASTCTIDVVIQGTVAAAASGTCCNTGLVSYTDVLGPHTDVPTPKACFTPGSGPSLVLKKDPAAGQTSTPDINADVKFEITAVNGGTVAVNNGTLVDTLDPCFQPLGLTGAPCGANVCDSANCPTPLPNCTYTPTGFSYTGLSLPAGGQQKITVTAKSGANSGLCKNSASITSPVNVGPAVAQVTITPQAVLNITKVPDIDPAPPSTSAASTYTITVTNTGSTTATECTLVDSVAAGPPASCSTLNACMPLPAFGAPGSCDTGTSVATSAPFTVNGGGGTQTFQIKVNTGPVIAGRCTNHVSVSCRGGTLNPASADGSIAIGTASTCDLAFIDAAPPKTGNWVYTVPCAALAGAQLLDATTNTPIPNPPVGLPLTAQPFAGPPISLRLYQQTCGSGCTRVIQLTKDSASGNVKYN